MFFFHGIRQCYNSSTAKHENFVKIILVILQYNSIM